jgi:phospholipid transport system substrate-binding protein
VILNLNRRAVLGLGVAFWLTPVAARSASPHESYVKSLLEELIALAKYDEAEQRNRLKKVLHRRADVRAISLFALGTWRKKLPKNLSGDYIDLVVNYTANSFISYVSQFEGADVAIERSSSQGGFTTVDAKLTYAGGDASQIRFRFADAGNPRVKDVNVRGIWLSLQLRERFSGLLDRNNGDIAELMEFLRSNSA